MNKNKNLKNLMLLICAIGSVLTYLFVNYYNQHPSQEFRASQSVVHEEVNPASVSRIKEIISQQKNNPQTKIFAESLEKELLDLSITKEVHLHDRKLNVEKIPEYPLAIMWLAITALMYFVFRRLSLKEERQNQKFQKVLDHLEMNYTAKANTDFDQTETGSKRPANPNLDVKF